MSKDDKVISINFVSKKNKGNSKRETPTVLLLKNEVYEALKCQSRINQRSLTDIVHEALYDYFQKIGIRDGATITKIDDHNNE